VDLAIALANDETAIIRNESIKLWIAGIDMDSEFVRAMEKLVFGGWHARFVAAQIIEKMGVRPEFADFAEILSRDAVDTVRWCMARTLTESSYDTITD
jgi:hypothetical protein